MFETYGDDVAFYLVYIREAHALDGGSPSNFAAKDGTFILDPISADERVQVASQCVTDLDLPMPALIDGMDDAVNQAYQALPDRLYLVSKGGQIGFAGARGPFGFKPDDLEDAIKKELKRIAPPADATGESDPGKGSGGK